MLVGNGSEPYIPIDTSEKSEISGDGRDVHPGIIHANSQNVGGMEREEGGDIERTSSISSRMFTYVFAIDEEGSRLVCSIQFSERPACLSNFWEG